MRPFDVYVPANLADALGYLDDYGETTSVLAGGTDLLPRLRRRQYSATNLLDISGLKELRYIRSDGGSLHLGALTTVSELLESSLVGRELELVREAARKFGSPQIRNVATVGGNTCSASSSEDLIPVFLALDARVKLTGARKERVLPLKNFIVGKRTTIRKSGEILSEVEVPALPLNSASAYEKMGRRGILIIALVNMAVVLSTETDRETIGDARIALNRLSGRIPQRASSTEALLVGKKLTSEDLSLAQASLSSELSLTSDFRASGEYRLEVAKVFLERLLKLCASRVRES